MSGPMYSRSSIEVSRQDAYVYSFDGYLLDSQSDVWQLNRERRVFLSNLLSFLDVDIVEDVRRTLVYFAQTKSATYTQSIVNSLLSYINKTNSKRFDERGLFYFRNLNRDKNRQEIVSKVRIFIKQADFLGYKIIDETLLEQISYWTLSGADKGVPVLSLDPEKGPFSDLEFEAIVQGMDHAFAEGNVTVEEYVVVQLFAATGRRSIQVASLKIGDLYVDSSTLSDPFYCLNVPRAKQRYQGFRSSFRPVAILESLGKVLLLHIENVVSEAEALLRRRLSRTERNALPLFPMGFGKVDRLRELHVYGEVPFRDLPCLEDYKNRDLLLFLQSTDYFHCSSRYLLEVLRRAIDSLSITSERTGQRLHVNAYRF